MAAHIYFADTLHLRKVYKYTKQPSHRFMLRVYVIYCEHTGRNDDPATAGRLFLTSATLQSLSQPPVFPAWAAYMYGTTHR